MIKPTYLWALCKTCKDSKWIGDICRFLGGQDVKLDFGQGQVAEMIKMDSEWMDERINWNREAARMRQARARERKAAERAAESGKASREVTQVTRDNGASREVTPPSRHPSVHPSCNNNILHDSTKGIGRVKDRNNNTHIPPHPPTGGVCADSLFEEFWAAYPRECPRKVDKAKCRRKVETLLKGAKDREAFAAGVMAGLERWKRSETWQKDGGEFIRSPLVWLNGESWRDDPKPAKGAAEDAKSRAAKAEAAKVAADLRREGLMP
jgi:hypothetical protein